MLEIRNLKGGWDETTVVDDLSISVRPKETIAILGRNGVGKTTLLELITGRCRRHGGALIFDGTDISSLSTQRRAQLGIGYVPQTREVFPSLSVRENITVACRPGFWDEKRLMELFPSLARRSTNLGGQLSGGEQQMLAIARALAGNPKLLLMDEPSEGLAPVVVEQLVLAMKELATSSSLAIVLVEQRADIGLELCDRYVVVERGKIVSQGASQALLGDDAKIGQLIGLSVH
ncbi:ABC transporter ATP-binding protein [Agrobacterium tumefaciens]|jgi:branched-chain amino acid transport system ATP-binding protein|uniref:ABC transporter ATP-binding protein n=1 Tax=Agrobacterium tumefaciens TaxID=358 RepID=UPI0009783971|nr:ABC transporter ATP-binding protein [Agrobacterium tumefaciens]